MKIRVYQGKVNSDATVVIATTDWRHSELDAIVKFGEPQVDVGGVFAKKTHECLCEADDDQQQNELMKSGESLDSDCFFELAENVRGIRRDFPISQSFPDNIYSNPDEYAKWWSDEVVRRIIESVQRLKILSASDVSREEVYEV